MIHPQFILPIADELIVDLFAGGGGASTGIEAALGRHVDVAVNHDRDAVLLHEANHPQTRHFVADVFEVDPIEVTQGRPVGMLWASPDCKHFSKAKGGKPVSKKIRSLAWVVIKWAKLVRPRVILLENVEEFKTWGPLCEAGTPCPIRKGQTFDRWQAQLSGRDMAPITGVLTTAYSAGWIMQYNIKALLEQAIANGDLTKAGIRAAVSQLTDVDYEGMLPNRGYDGAAADQAWRTTSINRVVPGNPDGLESLTGLFEGPTAAAYDFSAPCYNLGDPFWPEG